MLTFLYCAGTRYQNLWLRICWSIVAVSVTVGAVGGLQEGAPSLSSLSVHARNKRFVKRELGSCGITLTPESAPVVRLPSGSDYNNKMDLKMVLRKTLKASYMALCV